MMIPKEPYEPWNIEETKFPKDKSVDKQAKFLLNYAILAPSAFNVQPWLFEIRENKIYIYPDFSRSLSTSDKDNRLLYVSIGCAVKNLEVAATAFGFEFERKLKKENQKTFVEVTLKGGVNPKVNSSNLDLIKSRLTNRSPYILDKNLSGSFLKKLQSVVEKKDLDLIVTQDEKQRENLTNLTVKADLIIWNDPDFKAQHLKWVRHNLTKEPDGMPAFTVGIPTFVSFFAKLIISSPIFAKIQATKNKRLLKSTPYFGFILSQNHDQETWIKVGEIYEELSLLVTKENLALAPLAEVVEVGEIYKETMKTLGTNLRPQIFFRLGYPSKSASHSPRRRVEDFLLKTEN